MDLEIVGRHVLLFDDDAIAAFVNSQDALVEWHSLLIDRYDVRHLLQSPPPPLKRRRHPSSPPPLESELDLERFLDLPPPSDDRPDESSLPELNNGAEPAVGGTYNAVAFSYGNPDADQKNSNAGLGHSGFLPPFPVPESLLQNLPPTEKLHQIMARTAIFVSEHGGQSEIVLRVKQGDNPTFGFLMPDHHLHAYFRFLVDHPEVLKSDMDSKTQDEDKKADGGQIQTGDVAGGALSLLGSVYGTGEDEDGALHVASESIEKEPGDSSTPANTSHPHGSEQALSSTYLAGKDEAAPRYPLPQAKEKAPSSKRYRSVTAVTTGTTKKKEGDASSLISASVDKPQASTMPNTTKVEPLILEPPSQLKRMMDKIIEFILKNGKEFEAVLIKQDATTGRFPFLLPSNQYHPYYLKVLQDAQESKQAGKSFASQKHDSMGHPGGKKAALSKDTDTLSKASASHEVPYYSERKEKFKMVIGGSKKDAQEPPPKPTQQQCGVSVDAAAAILQAATRGLKNPKFDILSKTSLDDSSLGLSGEGGPTSSFGSLSFSSRARSSTPKPVTTGVEPSVSMPIDLSGSVGQIQKECSTTSDVLVAKAIAKTAALAAASEADSSEACLTREQKQKAERLKRAKMFAAMIKGGAAPHKNELLPCLSAEPPDSGFSGLVGSGCKASSLDGPTQAPDASDLLGAEVEDLVGREREGSSVPIDVDTTERIEKSEKKDPDDDYKERRLRKKHFRSRRLEEDDDEEEERDHKHSRKKHRSHHSSHHSRDEHNHRKRHSSSKDRESRHRHKHQTSEDEYRHRSRSNKHGKRSHSERKVESEDEEIRTKPSDHSNTVKIVDCASRETSLDLPNDRREGSTPLVADTQPTGTTEVSNELRAKVRAMLLATM